MVICFSPICKHRTGRETCKFYRFPKDEKVFAIWKKRCRRKDKEPKRTDRLCSCHFVDGEKGIPIFPWNKNKKVRMNCVYPSCGNEEGRSPTTSIRFFKFPDDPELCSVWVDAIGKSDWKPGPLSSICSAHFKGTAYTDGDRQTLKPNAVPIKSPLYKKKIVMKKESDSKPSSDTPTIWRHGRCHLCNTEVEKGLILLMPTTTSKVPMHKILSEMVNSGEIMVGVDEDAILCKKCVRIINYRDRIMSQRDLVQKVVLNRLCTRYGILPPEDEPVDDMTNVVEFIEGDVLKLPVNISNVLPAVSSEEDI